MTIFKKLIEAQKGFEKLIKNSKADRYKYADLPAVLDLIMPELHARNLFLHQKTSTADNYVVVETVVYDESGNSVSGGQLAMPTAGLMQKGAQAFGSALTYARRYSLTAFFCLAAEDDDGNQARRAYEEHEQKKEEPKPIDVKQVCDSMRKAGNLNTLERYYRNAKSRATAEQMVDIDGVYEELKPIYTTFKEEGFTE